MKPLAAILCVLCVLCGKISAAWLTFSTDANAPWDGCTGYSLWMQPTNAPDKNKWDWQGTANGWTNTQFKTPASLPSPCWLAVTADIGFETNSFKSAPILYDTNALNRMLPLIAPTNLVLKP
jgi:hypothetical protein